MYLPSLVSSSASSFFSPSEEIQSKHIVPIEWCSFDVLQLTKVNVCHQFINHFCFCCLRYCISAHTTPTRKFPWNLTRSTQRAENDRNLFFFCFFLFFSNYQGKRYALITYLRASTSWVTDKKPSYPLPLSLAPGISSLPTCSTDLSAVW